MRVTRGSEVEHSKPVGWKKESYPAKRDALDKFPLIFLFLLYLPSPQKAATKTRPPTFNHSFSYAFAVCIDRANALVFHI